MSKISKSAANKAWIERRTGVQVDTRCLVCNRTAEESFNLGPVETGINHPEYYQTYSFYRYPHGHMCPRCHREKSLRDLFDLMDKQEKRLTNGKSRLY